MMQWRGEHSDRTSSVDLQLFDRRVTVSQRAEVDRMVQLRDNLFIGGLAGYARLRGVGRLVLTVSLCCLARSMCPAER